MSREIGVYVTYKSGEKKLIARVTSVDKAIEIVAKHHEDAGCVGTLIRSEPEEAGADE